MILLTGANGFIGRAVAAVLKSRRMDYRAAVRSQGSSAEIGIGDIDGATDWSDALRGISCVIHTAARVHVLRDSSPDPLAQYRVVNLDGTMNLARQAAAMSVKRFVFLSSIKVNGEKTCSGRPFTARDEPHPADAYAISKFEAEEGLRQLASDCGIEAVVIRPPMVYGPGVKGNFARLLDWVERGLPLPFGSVDNRRSLVALDNLVDLILTCVEHPVAADRTWLVSDGEDLSTPALLRRLGDALGSNARLVPVPSGLLKVAAAIMGRRDEAGRLLESLQVDILPTRELLGWKPPVSVEEGLQSVTRDFLSRRL